MAGLVISIILTTFGLVLIATSLVPYGITTGTIGVRIFSIIVGSVLLPIGIFGIIVEGIKEANREIVNKIEP